MILHHSLPRKSRAMRPLRGRRCIMAPVATSTGAALLVAWPYGRQRSTWCTIRNAGRKAGLHRPTGFAYHPAKRSPSTLTQRYLMRQRARGQR